MESTKVLEEASKDEKGDSVTTITSKGNIESVKEDSLFGKLEETEATSQELEQREHTQAVLEVSDDSLSEGSIHIVVGEPFSLTEELDSFISRSNNNDDFSTQLPLKVLNKNDFSEQEVGGEINPVIPEACSQAVCVISGECSVNLKSSTSPKENFPVTVSDLENHDNCHSSQKSDECLDSNKHLNSSSKIEDQPLGSTIKTNSGSNNDSQNDQDLSNSKDLWKQSVNINSRGLKSSINTSENKDSNTLTEHKYQENPSHTLTHKELINRTLEKLMKRNISTSKPEATGKSKELDSYISRINNNDDVSKDSLNFSTQLPLKVLNKNDFSEQEVGGEINPVIPEACSQAVCVISGECSVNLKSSTSPKENFPVTVSDLENHDNCQSSQKSDECLDSNKHLNSSSKIEDQPLGSTIKTNSESNIDSQNGQDLSNSKDLCKQSVNINSCGLKSSINTSENKDSNTLTEHKYQENPSRTLTHKDLINRTLEKLMKRNISTSKPEANGKSEKLTPNNKGCKSQENTKSNDNSSSVAIHSPRELINRTLEILTCGKKNQVKENPDSNIDNSTITGGKLNNAKQKTLLNNNLSVSQISNEEKSKREELQKELVNRTLEKLMCKSQKLKGNQNEIISKEIKSNEEIKCSDSFEGICTDNLKTNNEQTRTLMPRKSKSRARMVIPLVLKSKKNEQHNKSDLPSETKEEKVIDKEISIHNLNCNLENEREKPENGTCEVKLQKDEHVSKTAKKLTFTDTNAKYDLMTPQESTLDDKKPPKIKTPDKKINDNKRKINIDEERIISSSKKVITNINGKPLSPKFDKITHPKRYTKLQEKKCINSPSTDQVKLTPPKKNKNQQEDKCTNSSSAALVKKQVKQYPIVCLVDCIKSGFSEKYKRSNQIELTGKTNQMSNLEVQISSKIKSNSVNIDSEKCFTQSSPTKKNVTVKSALQTIEIVTIDDDSDEDDLPLSKIQTDSTDNLIGSKLSVNDDSDDLPLKALINLKSNMDVNSGSKQCIVRSKQNPVLGKSIPPSDSPLSNKKVPVPNSSTENTRLKQDSQINQTVCINMNNESVATTCFAITSKNSSSTENQISKTSPRNIPNKTDHGFKPINQLLHSRNLRVFPLSAQDHTYNKKASEDPLSQSEKRVSVPTLKKKERNSNIIVSQIENKHQDAVYCSSSHLKTAIRLTSQEEVKQSSSHVTLNPIEPSCTNKLKTTRKLIRTCFLESKQGLKDKKHHEDNDLSTDESMGSSVVKKRKYGEHHDIPVKLSEVKNCGYDRKTGNIEVQHQSSLMQQVSNIIPNKLNEDLCARNVKVNENLLGRNVPESNQTTLCSLGTTNESLNNIVNTSFPNNLLLNTGILPVVPATSQIQGTWNNNAFFSPNQIILDPSLTLPPNASFSSVFPQVQIIPQQTIPVASNCKNYYFTPLFVIDGEKVVPVNSSNASKYAIGNNISDIGQKTLDSTVTQNSHPQFFATTSVTSPKVNMVTTDQIYSNKIPDSTLRNLNKKRNSNIWMPKHGKKPPCSQLNTSSSLTNQVKLKHSTQIPQRQMLIDSTKINPLPVVDLTQDIAATTSATSSNINPVATHQSSTFKPTVNYVPHNSPVPLSQSENKVPVPTNVPTNQWKYVEHHVTPVKLHEIKNCGYDRKTGNIDISSDKNALGKEMSKSILGNKDKQSRYQENSNNCLKRKDEDRCLYPSNIKKIKGMVSHSMINADEQLVCSEQKNESVTRDDEKLLNKNKVVETSKKCCVTKKTRTLCSDCKKNDIGTKEDRVISLTSNVNSKTDILKCHSIEKEDCVRKVKRVKSREEELDDCLDGVPPFIKEVFECENICQGFDTKDLIFVLSLLPDIEEMTSTQKVIFQSRAIKIINDVFRNTKL